MSRIIEEKFRQRSTSTGSLDGMVITRDNKLISLRTGADYELVRQAAVAAVCVEGQAGSHGHIGQFSSASLPSPMRRFSASDRFVNLPPNNSNQPPVSCQNIPEHFLNIPFHINVLINKLYFVLTCQGLEMSYIQLMF